MPVTMKRAQRRREYRDLWKRYCRERNILRGRKGMHTRGFYECCREVVG